MDVPLPWSVQRVSCGLSFSGDEDKNGHFSGKCLFFLFRSVALLDPST